ncbi:unnamed protein product [Orchesella dallaii]|uniref:Uncharacterized protein n=1 Tax=Orchesella dallaii TaxID=48710 RepID=A0ABP1PVI7_9HEXA
MSNVQRRPYISQEETLLARSRLRTPQQGINTATRCPRDSQQHPHVMEPSSRQQQFLYHRVEAKADWSSPFSVREPPQVPPRPSTTARSEQRGYVSTPAPTAAQPPVPPRMNTLGVSTVDPFAAPSSYYQPNHFGGFTGENRPFTQQQNPFPQLQDPASPPQLGSTFQTMMGEQNRQIRIFVDRQGKGKHLPNFPGNPQD